MSTVSPFSTIDSVCRRNAIRSAIETIFRPCFFAISCNWGRRAIVPSSFMISTSAPPGVSPAMRVRSTTASVWPGRRSTPRSRARSGNMCPGRPSSSGFVAGSTSARIVLARSATEIPVVHPCVVRSTETVNGVSCSDVLWVTIIGRFSSSQRDSGSGAQISPRPWAAMKLTISGVIFSPATMKSPSFSRSSSSTTISTRPARISSIASSTELNILS